MKVRKYYVTCVYILQSKMGKTEKKQKENHASKVTKIPKTKRQKCGMNKTKVLLACYTMSKYSLMSPVLMHLHKPYAATIGSGIHFVWFLMIVIGASSAYFHATLSLFGQLLDEIAILRIIMVGFSY